MPTPPAPQAPDLQRSLPVATFHRPDRSTTSTAPTSSVNHTALSGTEARNRRRTARESFNDAGRSDVSNTTALG
jgi:hypothetical protein